MGAIELDAPPSLLPLYAKAALTMPLHRGGDTLPADVYTLREQRIDPAHVAAYQKVCGFRVTDVLPATYLHVLAFPLSVSLMTQRQFPFPLAGLVHVGNSITQTRPVGVAETVTFQLRAADLRPHAAGRQFDVLAEASVGGELVWTGRSTYLRRGKPADDSKRKPGERSQPGPPAGAVAQVRVPGDIGRRYGAVSGDRNPIHLNGLAAKAFGFPSAIAHGMWLKARSLATLEGRLPEAYTVEVSFKLPVLLPATVAIAAAENADGWTLDVRDARSGKPHLAGTVTRAAVVSAPAPAKKPAVAKKPPAKKPPAKKTAAKKATENP